MKVFKYQQKALVNYLYTTKLFCFGRIIPVKLGDLGEGTKEAEVKKWHKKEGELIEEEDKVVEVGTDKLVADIPSPVTGMIHKIFYQEGEICQVGKVLCEVKADDDESQITEQTEKASGIVPLDKSKCIANLLNIL